MSVKKSKDIVRRLHEEVINQRKTEILDDIVATDAVTHTAWGEERKLYEAIKKMVEDDIPKSFPDGHNTLEHMIAEGDLVGVWITGSGTFTGQWGDIPPTNKKGTVQAWSLLRIAKGKIVFILYQYCKQ